MTRTLEIIPAFRNTHRPFIDLFELFLEDWMRPYYRFEALEGWVPASEIAETDKEYVVIFELPGIDMKGLDISYKDGLLTVKGEKKNDETEGESFYCSERYSGSFERSLVIPGKIKEDKIDATFNNGILKLILPKSEESAVKRIEVH
jgi:HSP20 family protein